MKHFRKIEFSWVLDALPEVKQELIRQPEAWRLNESRQKSVTVQQHTETIFLRNADRKDDESIPVKDVHASKWTGYSKRFPVAVEFLKRLAFSLEGDLGRAVYTRLLPGYVVYPHIDHGQYYAVRDRYHLVLWSEMGSYLRSGDEELVMQENELWWFDNKTNHDSRNDSSHFRTHLIFDILTAKSQR